MKISNLLKKSLFTALLTIMICSLLPVQALGKDSPENQLGKVEAFVESQRMKYNIPGLAVGIVKGEEAVYMKGFGTADADGRPITPQTPFLLGSVSKSFTALAIMQLVDEGKVKLDDSVDKYLPSFKATYKGEEQKLTIRQFLHHTSGMKDFYVGSVENSTTLEQLVYGHLNNTQLRTLPGTLSYYSNANYIILGEIVQTVSGMTFGDYVTKKIFEPLEMKHSYVSKAEAVRNGLSDGNRKWFGLPGRVADNDISFFSYDLASGYLISCIEDMTHYVSALMNEGRYKSISIASRNSIELLFNTEVQEDYVSAGIEGTKSYYGFGWRIIYNNDKLSMYQHTGETAEYHSNVVIKPEEQIGVIQLANLGGDMTPTGIGIGAADIMLGKEPKISNFINTVYMVERAIVLLIIVLLLVSALRLRSWKMSINKSRGRRNCNIVFSIIINIAFPIFMLVYLPSLFNAEWASSMLIFPDVAWTVLITSTVLLLIGGIKAILLIK